MSIALLAAIIAGALVAIQSAMLGAFGARLDPFVAATWVHLGGLTFGITAVLVTRRSFALEAVRSAPWGPLAGVAGVLLITGIAVAVGGIGLASTLAVVTGAQLLVGVALEATGTGARMVAIDPLRIGGALLIVAGVYLVVSRGPAVA
jgi:uncharacterized membrane protein YdcZ (DUF606 family)